MCRLVGCVGRYYFWTMGGWIAATADGHYHTSPGAEEKDLFRIRILSVEGETRDIKPAQFQKQYQWHNDPDKPLKALR